MLLCFYYTYLGRIDLLEVFDDGDDAIGNLGFVEEGTPDLFGEETAPYRIDGRVIKISGGYGLYVHPQVL